MFNLNCTKLNNECSSNWDATIVLCFCRCGRQVEQFQRSWDEIIIYTQTQYHHRHHHHHQIIEFCISRFSWPLPIQTHPIISLKFWPLFPPHRPLSRTGCWVSVGANFAYARRSVRACSSVCVCVAAVNSFSYKRLVRCYTPDGFSDRVKASNSSHTY